MSLNSDDFRKTMGRYATGVTVATAALPDGRRAGLTVNSFTSVSLDPPLVLFCLDNKGAALEVFAAATHYAINILSAQQEEVSRAFAKRGQSEERWQAAQLSLTASGTPQLDEALATIDCRISQRVVAGDHTILIGEVVGLEVREGQPLLYWASAYRQLAG
jgi:flavin reductase (DIM6/NTAB) family NADH-FMN oxidoreductase RutF